MLRKKVSFYCLLLQSVCSLFRYEDAKVDIRRHTVIDVNVGSVPTESYCVCLL